MDTPTVGRIVHFLDDSTGRLECRAGIITHVYLPIDKRDQVSLTVFTPSGFKLVYCADHDEDLKKGAGTWHWPERT